MLLGLIALFGSMQLIKYSMSAGVAGEGKIVSSVIWPRWCENGFLAFTIFSFSLAVTLVKKVLKWFAIGLAFVVFVSQISKLFIRTSFFVFTFIISLIVFHTVSHSFLFSWK